MSSQQPDISVSIVSYNTADLLRACVKALLDREADGEAELEIIVADNGSTDGSEEMIAAQFPSVRFIKTGGNIGYGRANNAGLAQAHGRYFFILNSDTEVLPGALHSMKQFLDQNPLVGMVGAQLLSFDGTKQPSCSRDPNLAAILFEQLSFDKLFPRNPVTGHYLMLNKDTNIRQEVEWVCGACFFVRAEAYWQINGFDPAYFMYFEDTDFCIRLRRAGWKIWFLPDAKIHHHLGASSKKDWRLRARMIGSYNQSRYHYYCSNFGRGQAAVLKTIVVFGALLRLAIWSVLALVKKNGREQVVLFWDVVKRTVAIRP